MKQRILIAGGTGFIGRHLQKRFSELGYEVLIISRKNKRLNWNNEQAIVDGLQNAHALINLAGKSVDCRYNEKNKRLIFQSRVETTRALQSAIEKCATPPKVWINAGTATIYRHSEDKEMNEESGEIGSGFSVEVAKAWEYAFFEKPLHRTRKVALRIAIVLGKNGGVIRPFTNLVRFGLGGKQGNGRQMFSWIHEEDLFRIIQFVISNEGIRGVYNAAAPNPITNKMFMEKMRSIFRPWLALSSPKFLLDVGAYIVRTETELILKSRWVVPSKLLQEGFRFKYPKIDNALNDILKK
jgi:uncharacterized protein (TIGR01777 family)